MLIVKQSKREEEESSEDLPGFISTGTIVFGRVRKRASTGSVCGLQDMNLE